MAWKWIGIGVLALLVGIGAGALSRYRQQQVEEQVAVSAAETEPVSRINLTGVLGAREVVSIPAPIDGVLEMVLVTVGDEVYENMPLAMVNNAGLDLELQLARERLDEAVSESNSADSAVIAARLEASRAAADLSRVRTEYERAQQELQRQLMLYREGATPRQVYEKVQSAFEKTREEFDVAQAAARQADDRVDTAQDSKAAAGKIVDDINREIEQINLDMAATQITSPVAGIITGMAARQGEEVHPSMETLFQVAVDLSRMYVSLEPNPVEMSLIRPGQKALVHVAEMPAYALEGEVSEMRVGQVQVDFINPTPAIRPGLTAEVTILVQAPPAGTP